VTTRITQGMLNQTLLYDLQNVTTQLSTSEQELSSGYKLNQPSDDPYGASQALKLRADLASNQQYQGNVSDANAWQSVADTALGDIGDSVQRARDLVIQGANGTNGPSDRTAIVTELNQLIDSIKTEANTQYAGRYIFAGTATNTVPYPQPGLTYAGDDNVIKRVVGQGQTVDVNQRGWDAFSNPPTTSGQNVLQLLDQIRQDLASGNQAALGNGDMTAIDSMLDQLSSARAEAGASANRLTTLDSRLKDTELNVQSLLSKTQDADMAKTMVDFSQQQAVYQAALQAGAKIIKPTLLDFLG
jgi:flagellar hook-associated protein 3 FlgL